MNNSFNYPQRARHLIVIEDQRYRQTISLEEETYSIGRQTNNSIVIYSQQASRYHGTLMKRKDRNNNGYSYWIIDGDINGKKSRNGIYVNGEKCFIKELKNGDLINFGCEVNATYYSTHELSNTVINITKNTHQQQQFNHRENHDNCGASQASLDINYAPKYINPKDTLQSQEYQDTLTKLPNRILFKEYIINAFKNAQQYHLSMAIIIFDINHFRAINKNWGYPVGDKILVEVAERIKSSLRDSDIVARWGDDEFIILLPKISCSDDLEKITTRILDNIRQSLQIFDSPLYLEYSYGRAIYPQEAQEVKTLLRKAEMSLFEHKKQMKSPQHISDLTIDPKASKLLKAKSTLQQALDNHELELYYQPQMKIKTGEISGIEALVRWNHPKLGQINPIKFIPIAEQTNLMNLIGQWILTEACRQNKHWQDLGFSNFRVSVNLSPLQLKDPNFVTIIERVLRETKLAPCWLELEITEKVILNDLELTHQVLDKLQRLGINLCLDDFGIGYSCLTHLPNFPFRTLKIAQSCVKEIKNKPEKIAVVSAAVAVGNTLDLRVVAEGVETHQQLDLLQHLDCQEVQGYILSHPLDHIEATQFLDLYQSPKVSC
ncbi:MAG: EAL domain-containing protein [Crocosphaera sp.]|nr:EAL domain-containing protein [Crocosphaera sp.]